MNRAMFRTPRMVSIGPLIGGGLLLMGAAFLIPDRWQIADAIRRAAFVPPTPATAMPPTTAMLMQRFTQGARLSVPELQRLMTASTAAGSAPLLGSIADRIKQAGGSIATDRIAYDIMANGRSDAALKFLESRPDAHAPSLWRLRFELHRKLGDNAGAMNMAQAAVKGPGSAPSGDIVQAVYAVGRPDLLVTAAENGAAPRLTRTQSLDLASWAYGRKRNDLIARIDRAGVPEWRNDNPWLAMTLAREAGDFASALRYASMLPSGRDEARESIIMASGDRDAIRRLLLEEGKRAGKDRSAAAQRLLENGFRADAIAVLRQYANGGASGDPSTSRMLYLMGPRPGKDDLEWLRSRAIADPRWLPPYLERERPEKALAFLEERPNSDETGMLLQRIRIANAAHDDQGAGRALDRLLDGRSLHGAQLKVAAAALTSAAMSRRYASALTRARIAAGEELGSDRMDLAWEAWNKGDVRGAVEQLDAHLRKRPDDQAALRLMANAQGKIGGAQGERPWLKRLLVLSAPMSRERAELLAKLGQTSDAIAMLETLRQRSPGDKQVNVQLARLLVASGDPGRARKVLQP